MVRQIIALPLPPSGARRADQVEPLPAPPAWTPSADVFETPAGLVITVELAGLRREDLELQVAGQELCIRGVRQDHFSPPDGRVLNRVIRYGAFETRLSVPADFDLTGARASYQNGFLHVEVPRRSAPAPERETTLLEAGKGESQ